MKKLATFYHVFWKSISSLAYYRDVINVPFAFSFKYFWLFSFVLGFILTTILSSVLVPPVRGFVTRFERRAANLYPNDLVITIADGKLSTNVTEPLRFPMPVELFSETPGVLPDQQQQYLVTIDTAATVDAYQTSQSIVFITRENIVVANEQGGYRVYPLSDIGDMTITKDSVNKNLQDSMPWVRLLPMILVGLLFLTLAIILPITRLLSLLFQALVLVLAARLMHVPLGYKKIYQIGLHALTLPTLIQIGMIALNVPSPIPFFNSILFVLYSLAILAELRKYKFTTRAR